MNRGYRQAVVDEYLSATGRDTFQAEEFLAWLEPKNNHRAWALFFSKSDQQAAHEHRLTLVRGFVSGLRITVTTSAVEQRVVKGVTVERPVVVRVPAFVSPRAKRQEGGGYSAVDPAKPESMTELFGQAADDLARWLSRYKGTATLAGANVASIEAVVEILRTAAEGPAQAAG